MKSAVVAGVVILGGIAALPTLTLSPALHQSVGPGKTEFQHLARPTVENQNTRLQGPMSPADHPDSRARLDPVGTDRQQRLQPPELQQPRAGARYSRELRRNYRR